MTISEFWHPGWSAAIFNHLWQSTLVALIAWLLTLALRSNPARVRYTVWMLASLKFLVPFALLASLGSHWARPVGGSSIVSTLYTTTEEISQPFQASQAPVAKTTPFPLPAHILPWAPSLIVAVWFFGVLVVLVRWIGQWRRTMRIADNTVPVFEGREIEALRHAERAAGLRQPIPLRFSERAMEPGIFGIFRPVLLWPAGISERLSDAQIEAIAAHEIEHVRRRDNLTAALHMLVEALFWFHPAVRWMGARLVDERERACDESVVEQSAKPETYAESILKVCAFCLEPPVPCVSGVSGSDLKQRVLRIMTHKSGTGVGLARRLLLFGTALLALAAPIGFGILHAMQAPEQLVHASSAPAQAFEVVSIKPNHNTSSERRIAMMPTGFTAEHVSLKDMIDYAYGIKADDQLLGTPAWAGSEYFDVDAKVGEADIEAAGKLPIGQRGDRLALMVQSMLADRFGLKATIETRELAVYALVVAKGGLKMKQVQVDEFPPPGTQLPPGPPPEPPPNAHVPRLMTHDGHHWTATAFPVDELAHWLSHFEELDNHIVVDETGLSGNYDWALNGVSMGSIEGSHQAQEEPTNSIFTALPEQLGLKLEPRKAPVEVLVVQQVERPSAN